MGWHRSLSLPTSLILRCHPISRERLIPVVYYRFFSSTFHSALSASCVFVVGFCCLCCRPLVQWLPLPRRHTHVLHRLLPCWLISQPPTLPSRLSPLSLRHRETSSASRLDVLASVALCPQSVFIDVITNPP